jgi:hypothetical protein
VWFLFCSNKNNKKEREDEPRVSGAVVVVQCVWCTNRWFDKHIVVAGRYRRKQWRIESGKNQGAIDVNFIDFVILLLVSLLDVFFVTYLKITGACGRALG